MPYTCDIGARKRPVTVDLESKVPRTRRMRSIKFLGDFKGGARCQCRTECTFCRAFSALRSSDLRGLYLPSGISVRTGNVIEPALEWVTHQTHSLECFLHTRVVILDPRNPTIASLDWDQARTLIPFTLSNRHLLPTTRPKGVFIHVALHGFPPTDEGLRQKQKFSTINASTIAGLRAIVQIKHSLLFMIICHLLILPNFQNLRLHVLPPPTPAPPRC
ncbi:hypothetical protein C8F04DRAFT_1126735 [Mycena alexandri]|uniref:Uncharacterized protein n=1 Tax=Mycena alexandri TaxID=1745969 RepID=A0AAD6RZT6_9AGAR|nr:hypothetical protein C8F04DRAFT_1152462 [Mycena alexandri]KAJ7025916.1 hypothetical protein C8F04DRAFT_1126735 [Mycena alexandri]